MAAEGGEGNYWIVRQGVAEVRSPENAPAVAMGEYLVRTDQQNAFRRISIYAERGDRAEEIRRLYMNEAAIRLWREMGRSPDVVGRRHRPPTTALLNFGVPFTE